jgi:hypothetical protein
MHWTKQLEPTHISGDLIHEWTKRARLGFLARNHRDRIKNTFQLASKHNVVSNNYFLRKDAY